MLPVLWSGTSGGSKLKRLPPQSPEVALRPTPVGLASLRFTFAKPVDGLRAIQRVPYAAAPAQTGQIAGVGQSFKAHVLRLY